MGKRSVTVANGYDHIQLPNGVTAEEGDTVLLTEDEFDSLAAGVVGTILTDNGAVATSGDAVTTQAAFVADGATVDDVLAALRGDGKPMATS